MNTKPKEQKPTFDTEIDRLLLEMQTVQCTSEEYRKLLDRVSVLNGARGVKTARSVSMETVVTVAANLVGLLLILNYEKTGAITSKAIGNLFKVGRG